MIKTNKAQRKAIHRKLYELLVKLPPIGSKHRVTTQENTMSKTKQDFYVLASAYYLREELPDNWKSLSDERLDTFVIKNVVGEYEHTDSEGLWELIDMLACGFFDVYTEARLGENNDES